MIALDQAGRDELVDLYHAITGEVDTARELLEINARKHAKLATQFLGRALMWLEHLEVLIDRADATESDDSGAAEDEAGRTDAPGSDGPLPMIDGTVCTDDGVREQEGDGQPLLLLGPGGDYRYPKHPDDLMD